MKDIVIVGAGASGLIAAKTLLEQGYHVTLLEARDRPGGRIHTFKEKFSCLVEGGAEFIHGKQELTFSLLKDARAEAILLKGKHYTIINGVAESGDQPDDGWDVFNEALKELQADATLQQFLDQKFADEQFADLRQRVTRFAEGFDIADTTRVSTLSLRDEWLNNDEAHQYHIVGGYKTIVEYLEMQVKRLGGIILFSSIVQEIHWKEGEVKVALTDGRDFRASKVLLTIPVGSMQHGDIKFSPPIPAYQKAFQQLGFGGAIKFIFEFNESIWQNNFPEPFKDASFIFSDAEIPTWWTQLPDETPILTGWLGGPAATYSTNKKEILYDRAVASLQNITKYSRNEIQKYLEHWHIADWVGDPFSRGAYSYPTINGNEAQRFLRQGLARTIFFGGEALYHGASAGTVEAALVNGKKTAIKIISPTDGSNF